MPGTKCYNKYKCPIKENHGVFLMNIHPQFLAWKMQLGQDSLSLIVRPTHWKDFHLYSPKNPKLL